MLFLSENEEKINKKPCVTREGGVISGKNIRGCGYLTHLFFRWLILLQCLLFSSLMAFPVLAAGQADDYDSLVHRARAGDTEPALVYLRQKGADASLQMRFDHIVIASWAGNSSEVIEVYLTIPATTVIPVPVNVVEAVGRAFRGMRRYDEALRVLRAGASQYPQESSFVPVLIMSLVDAGRADEAIKNGLDWVERAPQDEDIRLALAYAYVAQGHRFDALHQTDKAHQIAPQKSYVQDEYIRALQRVELFDQAWDLARALPKGRFTPAQMRAMEADVVALQTRLAAMPSRGEAERFVIADRALAHYDRLLSSWEKLGAQAAGDVTRIRIDRLAALHTRVRMEEVVHEYESLLAEGVDVPAWALGSVASAYLYLRQPERARDLYQATIDNLDATTRPEDKTALGYKNARLSNGIGLAYALSEAEQFAEMEPVLKDINAYQTAWLYYKGQPRPEPNAHYLNAQLTLVSANMAMDNTPAAQAHMEEMVTNAPNNSNLRANLAGIYHARAKPRLAERQLKIAETQEPRSVSVERSQALVALDLQEWRQVKELSEDLTSRFLENLAVQRLERSWQVHNMAELRVSNAIGLGSGRSIGSGGDVSIDTAIYSRPIDYNWRLFAGAGHAQGSYREGHGYYSWLRSGVEWRSRDVWLEGEISANHYADHTKMGARFSGSYDINDTWQVGGSAEHFSRGTSVRALRSRIYSDMLQTYLRWRGNERRQWQLSAAFTHYSDNNDRLAFGLSGRERLYTAPHLKVDFLFDVGNQRSSKDGDRPYFNPKRDVMLLPSLRITHTLYRRYERAWEHYATVSAGIYEQKGFDRDEVLGFEYGQRYRHNDVFEIGASINGLSRPYDGERERAWRLALDLTSRF